MPAPPKRNSSSRPQPTPRNSAPQSTSELIDPRWILKALAIVLAIALLCARGTLCLLWYQGQWQLVLHPSRTVATTPTSLGLNFTELHFADDATGAPQLDGWLIPSSGNITTVTVLVLHSGDGSISDALPSVLPLRNLDLNVLLFDYRGYGHSVGNHPTQATMQQDSEAALNWLISTQHIPPDNVILYGNGIGASLAVQLAAEHHDIPAIILDAPDGDLTDRVLHDAHSFLIPTHLLFHEDFPLAEPLSKLSTPKLLISYTNSGHPPSALANAADPKVTVEFPSPGDPKIVASIVRFFDLYVTHTPQ